MDFVIRKNISGSALKHHVQHCTPSFVQSLLCSWRGIKAEGTMNERIRYFHSLHKDRLALVFGVAIHTVVNNLHTPATSKAELYACARANELGRSLFDETVQSLLSSEISGRIAAKMATLKDTDMDQKLFDTSCREFLKDAQLADPHQLCRSRRTVKIAYRGIDVIVKVSSILSEIQLGLSALCKARAIADDLLVELQFEKDVVSTGSAPILKSVEESMVAHASAARSKMNAGLVAYDAASGQSLAVVVRNKEFSEASIHHHGITTTTTSPPHSPPPWNHHHHFAPHPSAILVSPGAGMCIERQVLRS